MATSSSTCVGEHAVVLGASIAGLLAARVLSDFYRTVTIVERDVLPEEPSTRRGVPQGRQVHALLRRGSQVLAELFPGLPDELVAAGAPVWDDGDLSKMYLSFGGHELCRSGVVTDPESLTMYVPSRPLLEFHVRRRVLEVANVIALDGHDVVDLMATADRSRVTGVRILDRGTDTHRVLTADVVVDAMGRGSRSPALLDGLGYDRPIEDELVVKMAYSSQAVRIPPGMVQERVVLVGGTPSRTRSMALFGYENDTWRLGLGDIMGGEPPTDFTEMLNFAETFAPEHVMAALRACEPIGEPSRYRVPSTRWRRYDRLRRFPAGLLVTGDAVCSFNPIYGQGMSVAASEAVVLRDCLRKGTHDLAARFFRASARDVAVAFQLAVGSDLALPQVHGTRSLSVRVTNWYTSRVQSAAASDPIVAERFLRVVHMVDSPASLLRPPVVLRVIQARRKRGGVDRVKRLVRPLAMASLDPLDDRVVQ